MNMLCVFMHAFVCDVCVCVCVCGVCVCVVCVWCVCGVCVWNVYVCIGVGVQCV